MTRSECKAHINSLGTGKKAVRMRVSGRHRGNYQAGDQGVDGLALVVKVIMRN